MRLLVLGAGSIGGYFGGRLAAAGTDVTFLVRPRRKAQLDRDGLRIISPLGDLTIPVRTVTREELDAEYDCVLLTCKAYDLADAIDAIAPAMQGNCVVVPMLNGMAHLDVLDARFGASRVMGGTCSISVALDGEGVIHHANMLQRIAFGERGGTRNGRGQLLADAFAATSIEWELSSDIMQNMWEKIAFLSVLAAANCLFRAHIGHIVNAPGGLEAIEQALDVNFEIAGREGHAPRTAAIEFARKTLTGRTSTLRGSMLHDLESGAPVESDHIIGWMLDRAKRHGIEATLLSHAYTSLKAYEARRLSSTGA